MKKVIFLLMAVGLLSACQQKMTIQGTIDPAFDLDSAEVTLFIQQQDTIIANTTTIQDGAFTLTQVVTEPQVTRLMIDGLGRYNICVEPGTVIFDVVANDEPESPVAAFISCTGTPNNDLLDAYNQQQFEAEKAVRAADTEETANQAWQAYIDMSYAFIKEHLNTLASTHVFADMSYYLSLDQVGEILAQLTPTNLAYGRIPRVQAGYEAMVKTAVGQPYTDFALPTPAGEELALSSLVGKTDYVLVDFWASWCGPCRRAMPALKELYAKYAGQLEVLGVSLDNDAEKWTGAIETLGLPWKHISDVKGWDCAAGKLYGVSAIPSTVLIDKDGIIIARNPSEKEIEAFLQGAK